MKAYYCTCLVKTGVQVYLAASAVLSVAVLALVLREHVLVSMARFFQLALLSSPRPDFAQLDFDLMRRSVPITSQGTEFIQKKKNPLQPLVRLRSLLVLVAIVVCATNILCNSLALVGVFARRHCLLVPWLVCGALEILALSACGAYHLYILWATHEDVIYQFGGEGRGAGGVTSSSSSSLEMILALRSSLSFGELCIYTCLASGGVLLYLAFLVYAWVMVKAINLKIITRNRLSSPAL